VVGVTDDATAMGIQVEIARILANTNKTILIIGFGVEELWFKGSEDFVKKHPEIVRNCDAMIDLNCVGAGEYVTPISSTSLPEPVKADPKLLKLIEESANELKTPLNDRHKNIFQRYLPLLKK
jgi:Predicted aminopeptidases